MLAMMDASCEDPNWGVLLKKEKKIIGFAKKVCETFGGFEKTRYLCTRNSEMNTQGTLGYGVMVTLQILVLSFMVRVRVPQQ